MDIGLDLLWVVLILVAWAALICAYLAPTVIAFRRDVINKWSVAVINVLLGWTLVGWAVALAMAVRTKTIPRRRWRIPLVRDQAKYSAK